MRRRVLLASLVALAAACAGTAAPPPGGGVPGGGSGGGTSPAWRPFDDASPWNARIPPDARLDPDSAALIADFRTSSPYGEHLDVSIQGYSIPLYWAEASTPVFPVRADIGGEGWSGLNVTLDMPIPAGAVPDPRGDDHHMLVVDKARGREWGCYDMRLEAGGWHAALCATADLGASGVRVRADLASPWVLAHGARACGYPLVAGLIRTDEIEAGRIDHALVLAYPNVRRGWFTPPASTASAIGSDGGIPCGGRIQFDPAVGLDTLGLSRAGRIIVKALQEYGAYVGDYSGALDVYGDDSAAAQAYWGSGVLDVYELQGKIDLSRFRVLELGPLYPN